MQFYLSWIVHDVFNISLLHKTDERDVKLPLSLDSVPNRVIAVLQRCIFDGLHYLVPAREKPRTPLNGGQTFLLLSDTNFSDSAFEN